MRVSPAPEPSNLSENSVSNIRLASLSPESLNGTSQPSKRAGSGSSHITSLPEVDPPGPTSPPAPGMAVASDETPFVKFLGTTDKRQETDDEEPANEPLELDNLGPTPEEGDAGVPYLIQRMQDRGTDLININFLHKYAREGNSQLLEQVLARFRRNHAFLRKKINELDVERLSPLHYAARYNHLECVKVLVEIGGADVSVLDEDRATPLHHAARYRRKKSNKAVMDKAEGGDDGEQVTPQVNFEERRLMSISNGRLRNAALISRLLAEEDKPTPQNSVILYLVERGAVVNQQDFYGCTALHYAAMRGNEVAAHQLLLRKDNETIEINDNELMTPLHLACCHNQVEVVRMLLEGGANIRAREESGFTPLHLAAAEGNETTVSMLFAQAEKQHKWQEVQEMLADVDHDLNTPLHVAVDNGALEVAKICIEKGADVNKQNSAYELPLHLAAHFGSEPLVRLLIENQARIDALDMLQQTALHKASARNHIEVVNLLLQNNADLERGDVDSYTPLLMAAVQGHSEVIKLLLSRDADIFASEMHDKTALYLSAEEDYPEALSTLLSAITDNPNATSLIDQPDKYNNTPLHISAKKGYIKCLELLLAAGAEVDAKNEEEETPLHLAALYGRTIIVKTLIKASNRSLVNDEDEDSNTPLHLAASRGHPKVLQILLDEGADIDARNSSKWSALDCAAHKGNVKASRVLLENDSPIDPTDKSKVTPLYLACKQGHQEMVELLLQWHADVSLRTVAENEDDPTNGSNCLDACIDNGHRDCAIAIIKSNFWEAALRNETVGPNGMRDTPMRKLIRKMPLVAEEVFNRCSSSNEYHPEHQRYKVSFNYEFLDDMYSHWDEKPQTSAESGDKGESDKGSNAGGMTLSGHSTVYDEDNRLLPGATPYTDNSAVLKKNHPLMIMVDSKREDLLLHPLVTSLLRHKWTSFGRWFYYTNLLVYSIFLAFFTTYVVATKPPYTFLQNAKCNVTTLKDPNLCDKVAANCAVNRPVITVISQYIVLVLAALAILKELGQLWVGKLNYFSPENIMEWAIYVLSFLTVFDIYACQKRTGVRQNWQWEMGAMAIFLAWLNLVLFLRKVPRFGIYVVMFTDVLMTFARFFVVFFLFMLAFAFGFFALMQNQVSFKNVPQAMIKTTIMMIGEFDFEDSFNAQYSAGASYDKLVFYDGVTYALFVMFIVIMSIIIMNLLVGLAVDDIKAVQDQAALKRLGMQVDMALGVESMLPQFIKRRFVIRCNSVKPNRILNRIQRFITSKATGDGGTKLFAQLNPELDNWEKIEENQERMENQIKLTKNRVKAIKAQSDRLELMMKAVMDKLEVTFHDVDDQEDENAGEHHVDE